MKVSKGPGHVTRDRSALNGQKESVSIQGLG